MTYHLNWKKNVRKNFSFLYMEKNSVPLPPSPPTPHHQYQAEIWHFDLINVLDMLFGKFDLFSRIVSPLKSQVWDSIWVLEIFQFSPKGVSKDEVGRRCHLFVQVFPLFFVIFGEILFTFYQFLPNFHLFLQYYFLVSLFIHLSLFFSQFLINNDF